MTVRVSAVDGYLDVLARYVDERGAGMMQDGCRWSCRSRAGSMAVGMRMDSLDGLGSRTWVGVGAAVADGGGLEAAEDRERRRRRAAEAEAGATEAVVLGGRWWR